MNALLNLLSVSLLVTCGYMLHGAVDEMREYVSPAAPCAAVGIDTGKDSRLAPPVTTSTDAALEALDGWAELYPNDNDE